MYTHFASDPADNRIRILYSQLRKKTIEKYGKVVRYIVQGHLNWYQLKAGMRFHISLTL